MSADTDQDRRRFLGTAATTIAAARLGVLGAAFQQIACSTHPQVAGRELSAVLDATSWLEAPAPTPDAVRGRVVLVDFCTYTCINWLRQLPYVRAWDARYRDHGLVVIGVHTPEFTFERDRDNVRRAVTGSRIEYPVVVDNDFAIWHAFRNNYWPAIYLIDAQGRVRHRQFGEGEYDRTERSVRRLLAEARDGSAGPEIAAVNARGVEAPADWGSLKSSETYMGYERTERLASPGGA